MTSPDIDPAFAARLKYYEGDINKAIELGEIKPTDKFPALFVAGLIDVLAQGMFVIRTLDQDKV